jgi:hypothetical protein
MSVSMIRQPRYAIGERRDYRMSFELRGMNASKKGPLEAGLRVLGDSNSAIACQLGAALLWRITSAARWRIRSSGKIGESTGKIGGG